VVPPPTDLTPDLSDCEPVHGSGANHPSRSPSHSPFAQPGPLINPHSRQHLDAVGRRGPAPGHTSKQSSTGLGAPLWFIFTASLTSSTSYIDPRSLSPLFPCHRRRVHSRIQLRCCPPLPVLAATHQLTALLQRELVSLLNPQHCRTPFQVPTG
jgi:hypothetical protein